MFELDMTAIRQSASHDWLMANPANLANGFEEISQKAPELAGLAEIAISHSADYESPELLTARLIAAAMRCCDSHNDDDQARDAMRADCLATPPHLQADLLEHFQQQGYQ